MHSHSSYLGYLFSFSQLLKLEERNKELVQELDRVRQELEKAKNVIGKTRKECAKILDEERKSMGQEMERVRNELVKEKKKVDSLTKAKRMSKGDLQEELFALQQQHQVRVIATYPTFMLHVQLYL